MWMSQLTDSQPNLSRNSGTISADTCTCLSLTGQQYFNLKLRTITQIPNNKGEHIFCDIYRYI